MEELALFIQVVLATLFLSSALSKLRKMPEHFAILTDYRLLPEWLVNPFGWSEVIIEFLVGLLLFFGFFQSIVTRIAIGLLVMYSLAVGINLLRGRREISCGCGGVVGTHHLSWWLVLRNSVLIIAGGWLIQTGGALGHLDEVFAGAPLSDAFGVRYWVTTFWAFAFLLFYMGVSALGDIRKRIAVLLSNRLANHQ